MSQPAKTRVCPKCNIEKPLTEEYWHRQRGKDSSKGTGFQVYCKPCKRAINLERYYEKPPVEVVDNPAWEMQCPKCGLWKPATREFWTTNRQGWQSHCRSCANTWHKSFRKDNRQRVMEHYSKGTPKCARCGETDIDLLVMDHINADGATHRKTTLRGTHIYWWLIKHNFPEGFRVLCHNCNWLLHKKSL